MYDKLRRTKDEVYYEINENKRIIESLEEKINILNKNTLSNRITKFLLWMIPGLAVSTLTYIPVANLFNIPQELIGLVGLKYIFIGGVTGGTLFERIVAKINKRKLNQFSNAKTENEKQEEILKYEIEVEKRKNKNIALKSVYEYTHRCQKELVCGASFDEDKLDKNEEIENNKYLTSQVKKAEIELDSISTQAVLNKECSIQRSKMFKNTFGVLCSIIGGAVVALFTFAAVIVCTPIVVNPVLPVFTNTLLASSAVIGCIGTGVGYTKLMNDSAKRFKKINDTLGNDKLETTEYFYENEFIDDLKESKIETLSDLYLQLQKSKRNLETIAITEKENEEHNHTSYSIQKEIINEQDNFVSDDLKEERSTGIEGPSLVKRY